jgi:hypothetical protein
MFAPVGFGPIDPAGANGLIVEWGHYLGSCERPSGENAWLLEVRGEPVAVALSACATSSTVAAPDGRRWVRDDLVELARLCSRPGDRWATRVALRLWREVAARDWRPDATAAIAYSQNNRHDGDIYRFDGWERIRTDAGSNGGGTWSTKREPGDPAHGKKSLWLWDYAP